MALDLSQGVVYRQHALRRMTSRKITKEQVEQALATLVRPRPARPLPNATERSMIYEQVVDGRPLKVYVAAGSVPPVVTTVAWGDE